MKRPLLTDNDTKIPNSAYFSAPSFDDFGNPVQERDVSWKIRFPNSRADLWNSMPCGDPVIFGIHHYNPLTLLCLERCLRLAHRHASQNILDGKGSDDYFDGFLMGTTANSDDENGIIIDLDRFDPGTVRSDGNKTPSTPLPGDVVIPVMFSNSFPEAPGIASTFSVQDYENSFKLLHHQVSSRLSIENTSLFPIRLHCFYTKDGPQYDDVDMELRWISPCISNSLRAIPIKPVPIIPTALAKNLAGPLNLSAMQNSSKTGYISMNQSRKLLLLLDSDPKSRSIPTVGIWVSGVLSVHSPIVWLACMRYLHCADVYERIMGDGQFLLVLYSILSQAPLFFQVKSDDNDKLKFDLLYSQQSLQVCKQPMSGPEKPHEFRFESTSLPSLPEGAFKSRELFLEALENVPPFLAPKKQSGNGCDSADWKENEEDALAPRGRQLKKALTKPQSILRNTSNARQRSGGSRNRSTPNGVSFSLSVDDSEIFNDATPLPLPSPHPSSFHQSPCLVKPSVPELSMVFDENYPAITSVAQESQRHLSASPTKRKVSSDKLNTNSPVIRSPLKNINNLNPTCRGVSPQDHRPVPIKPHGNHYVRHSAPNTRTSNNAFFPHHGPVVPVQRRSRSASDCMRGPNGSVPPLQSGPPPRTTMPHHARYNSTSMRGPRYQSNVPATLPAPYPYLPYPQARFQHPSRPAVTTHSYPTNPQMQPYPPHTVTPAYQVNNPHMAMANPSYPMNPEPPSSAVVSQGSMPAPVPAGPQLLTQWFPEPRQGPSLKPQGRHLLKNAQAIPLESPDWMKQLPPEAYQILMQQDAQLKLLQAQIQKLLAIQEGGSALKQEKLAPTTAETSTSTDLEETEGLKKISMGVNTGTSLCLPNSENESPAELATFSCQTTPISMLSSSSVTRLSATNTPGEIEQNSSVNKNIGQEIMPNKLNPLRCESQCTDKYPASEFASILLDETNLREIASANNEEDSDARSFASSLKAVDLPALETSTEQSSVGTPVGRASAAMIWNVQDSPVLGESASMCVAVPPINLNRSLQEAEEDENETENPTKREEPKDEHFMKNLLNQVRDMLKKADIDGGSEMSSESSAASTPQRSEKREKTTQARRSKGDRVAKATRKQLRKMGVNFDSDTVGTLSTAVAGGSKRKGTDAFTCALPEPLIPRLNYISILAESSSESVFPGPSSTELSMHANAIALKYLSNEQLEEIAALSKLGKNVPDEAGFSPLKSKSLSSSNAGAASPSIYDLFGADCRKLAATKHLPGMSLVSPCNMSLATRKYMEKYGLIDGNSSSDGEEEDEEERKMLGDERPLRPETPVNSTNYPRSANASPVLKGTQHVTHPRPVATKEIQASRAEGYPEFPEAEQGFSELKMNLGDTLDMMQPFLDDLGRHRQQTPSSNGQDSGSGTRSSQTTGSSRDRLTSVSERALLQHESPPRDNDSTERITSPCARQPHENQHLKCFNGKEACSWDKPSDDATECRYRKLCQDNNEASQVLSSEILRAIAERKKHASGGDSHARCNDNNPPLSHRCSYTKDEEYEEDFLAGTWPRQQFRSRSESEFHQPKGDRRRLSSSPRFSAELPSSSRSQRGLLRPRTSPPTSSKLKRIRAIHERQPKQLEDVKEVDLKSETPVQDNYHSSGEEEEDEEPVLTSRVTDAFREKEETGKNKGDELSEKENNGPHFLQHLQTSNDGNENFLDLEKIRNLPKLELV